ncbi:SDR family NAD(P)-dependent oxidoreductase [Tessaracoccus sp. Z1128]
MLLLNKRAIVTGGAGGIGAATCRAMAREGAAVAVVDLNRAAAEAVAQSIVAEGGRAVGIGADVSDEAAVESVVARVADEFGGVDVVFNNAGIVRRTTAVETAVEDWDLSFAVNVRAIFLMVKHTVPLLEAAGGGSIINTGSGWGLKGGGRALPYCASKGAVVNMTRAMAIDHGPANIRVNSVNPGDTDTPMLAAEADQIGWDMRSFLADAADRPLRRVGLPSEIADVVVWLASDRSSFVTGAAILADGGGNA